MDILVRGNRTLIKDILGVASPRNLVDVAHVQGSKSLIVEGERCFGAFVLSSVHEFIL